MQNSSGLIPAEYNVVIEMDPVEERTAGGIILPTTKTERDELATDEGTLVALSPLAFEYAEWPLGSTIPQAGDRVLFAQYAGRLWKRGDKTFRILKDKDVIAIVEQTPALAAAA